MTDGSSLTMPATWPEWLSLANVLLTATFAFLTFLILRANRAAVAAMRDQMADQNRPYVHVSVQVAWLVEAVLRYAGKAVPVPALSSQAVLYPFVLDQPLGYLVSKSSNLEVGLAGAGSQFVRLHPGR